MLRRMASSVAKAVKIEVPEYSTRPDEAWSTIQVKQKVKTVKPQSPDKKKRDGHTRFVCISGIKV